MRRFAFKFMYLKRENLLHLYEIISNRIFDPSISQNGNILDPFVGGHLRSPANAICGWYVICIAFLPSANVIRGWRRFAD